MVPGRGTVEGGPTHHLGTQAKLENATGEARDTHPPKMALKMLKFGVLGFLVPAVMGVK